MSINLYNCISVEQSDKLEIILPQKDVGKIPTDKSNLIIQAMEKTFLEAGENLPNIRLTQENNIPFARGLGSSAACVVGGIVAANHMLENKLSFDEMLKIAISFDGHPDNVLPAFTGGLTTATMHDADVKFVELMPHEKFSFVFIIPDYELKTSAAREVLPNEYSRHDAVLSLCNAVVLTTSLVSGNEGNLKIACNDLLHQPYRKFLINDFEKIKATAYSLGADAFYLSGAGPTMACIISCDADTFTSSLRNKLMLFGKFTIIHSKPSTKGTFIE